MSLELRVHQASFSSDKDANLRKILHYLDESDAYLDIFPEYDMGIPPGGLDRDFVQRNAETITGAFIGNILDKTCERHSAVVFTAYLRENSSVYNATVLGEKGKIVAVYKKIHLFDAFGYTESQMFSPGAELTMIKLQDFKVGLAICFDLRFPELFRAMAYKGVNLFIVPSGWYKGKYKLKQWRALTVVRAHENISYLIAVNQTDPFCIGHSLVVSPLGDISHECDAKQTSFTVRIDRAKIEEAKKLVPILSLAKPELYKRFYGWG